ncbi:protein MpRLK-Pelle_URK-Pp-1b [Marchantia polymorpha subsp. ruderalis]|uniref:Protein kinase domain-containing protein n=2 Tax=Marchantia polymorpha TaxID=3197 RepID=A0AAF6B173_MARPO|nr:hypothetical protein MARPO_0004s0099 [Marchantia polymorpha]BBN05757.1 hypothetical protein Mp_3g15730 [Marchantia polymorpha subsp. ruderalis]|eukprot:PTQ48821.1 hypothetical protein MARPO_0004s0099 [Marchantia polymorpha]
MDMARYNITAGLLLLFAIAASTVSLTFCSVEEGLALVKLMTDWEMEFTSWIPNTDPCDGWENLICTGGHVTTLNLTKAGISGVLSEEIGVLSGLENLDLSGNDLRGPLPDSLKNCLNMRRLYLQDCNWDIPFPEVILSLQTLEHLDISGAKLSGSIPPEFYSMQSLKYVYLGNNKELTGNLEKFSLLSNLVNLSIWYLQFEEYVLPDKLSSLSKLQYLNCHDCNLHGGLPESYGELSELIEFNVRRNALTGGIPDSYKKLTNLKTFRADYNFLLGSFPNWMFTMWPNLRNLYLSANQFYGVPYNISYLERQFNLTTRINIMRWDCNYLTGNEACGSDHKNDCSDTTIALIASGNYVFDMNCYEGISDQDILAETAYCGSHTLTCDVFETDIVRANNCPACPPSQKLQIGASIDSGCLCYGTASDGSGHTVNPVVGVMGGLSSLFLIILGFVVWKRRKNFSFFDVFSNKETELSAIWEMPAGVHRFTVEELARITSDFDESHIIGAGGFGKVFWGLLDDGRMVAIKRASAGSLQGVKEFRNEVILLSRLHHRHLVRLEGFCEEKNFQVLVYEFMKRGNLGSHLYGGNTNLDWYKRLDIAYEVAQGLEYIHSFADPPVIHRDVKPSNILLDENMVAKLADFGISKESTELETHISTFPAGTAGYLDPEYYLTRQLTPASDVYAYGVVLLELVTGQVAIDRKRDADNNLIEWAKKRFKLAGVTSIIDPSIADDFSKDACTKVTELAFRCAQFRKSERPTMKEVLAALDPLILPKSSKSSPHGSDSFSKDTEWLVAKGKSKRQKSPGDSKNISSISSPSSDLERSFNVMDMSQEFAPR